MYKTLEELLKLAEQKNVLLWEIILENEMMLSGIDKESIFRELDVRYQVMEASASQAFSGEPSSVRTLLNGIAKAQHLHARCGSSICGEMINLAMARALSCSETNASMGRICAAPTAGACGILPAVLITLQEDHALSRQTVLEGLLTASGIGAVITKNATVSGAEGGCQAECGVAAAMAAAAAVQMSGGTARMSIHASAFALMNCMGLVCDPVAGLVQIPCAQRNASQTVNALLSADFALAGMESLIPPDEVVDAMYRVGRMLPPELKETGLGGIAATNTGRTLIPENERSFSGS